MEDERTAGGSVKRSWFIAVVVVVLVVPTIAVTAVPIWVVTPPRRR